MSRLRSPLIHCAALSLSLELRIYGSEKQQARDLEVFCDALRFIIDVLSCSYALSCEIEGLGDSSPTSPKPRKSMVKRLSL